MTTVAGVKTYYLTPGSYTNLPNVTVVGLAPRTRSRGTRKTKRWGRFKEGRANREIALRLGISPKTLDIHRANATHKLVRRGEPRTPVRAALAFLAGSPVGAEVEAADRRSGPAETR
jgi:hypothetical protein